MTARISLNLGRTGGHRLPLQSEHCLPLGKAAMWDNLRIWPGLLSSIYDPLAGWLWTHPDHGLRARHRAPLACPADPTARRASSKLSRAPARSGLSRTVSANSATASANRPTA